MIDSVSLAPHYPSRDRVSNWESLTGLPFDSAFITAAGDMVSLRCPRCSGYVLTNVPWITDTGTGFAQKDFVGTCMSCKGSFDREVSGSSIPQCVAGSCLNMGRSRLCACAGSVKTPLESFAPLRIRLWRAFYVPMPRPFDRDTQSLAPNQFLIVERCWCHQKARWTQERLKSSMIAYSL